MSERIDDDMLVCRCEEVTAKEVRAAIADGARDINGIKRRCRAGMGLCQGRTCEALVLQIMRQELPDVTPEQAGTNTPRTPQRPVSFNTLGGEEI